MIGEEPSTLVGADGSHRRHLPRKLARGALTGGRIAAHHGHDTTRATAVIHGR